jgi:hypothetical protein
MEHIQIQTTVEGMLFKLFGPGMLIEKLDLAIVRGACGRSMGYSHRIEYVNHFSILSIESQLVSNIS